MTIPGATPGCCWALESPAKIKRLTTAIIKNHLFTPNPLLFFPFKKS